MKRWKPTGSSLNSMNLEINVNLVPGSPQLQRISPEESLTAHMLKHAILMCCGGEELADFTTRSSKARGRQKMTSDARKFGVSPVVKEIGPHSSQFLAHVLDPAMSAGTFSSAKRGKCNADSAPASSRRLS